MKRVKNSDIKFKINKKLVYLPNFVIRFYTVNQKEYFFEKTQDDLVEYEREATVDDVEVILSGGTTVTEYYLPLNWSQLMFVGQGILNYKLTNNIEDPEFPDHQYNKEEVVTTDFYIDSIKVNPEPEEGLIERVVHLEEHLAEEIVNREEADTALQEAIDAETNRATSAETHLQTEITELSGTVATYDDRITRAQEDARQAFEQTEAEIARSTAAEAALDTKIDQEIADRIADVNAEEARAISAETALDTKIDAETNRATSAETALQTAINDEVSRAREAESGITNSLNAEVTRATTAENALDAKIDAETTRATSAEAALDVKIGTVSGNVISETSRATTAENALSGAIDSISAATSGSVEELDAKIDQEIADRTADVDAEETRAKGVENVLSGAIDTIDAKFIDDAKYEMSGQTHVINFYNGNTVKASIDCTDFLVDGMIDNVYIENGYLVIDFNTASGKQDIRIPLTDIFNPNNYYTKSETSGATEIANALALKLNISDFKTYSGAVDTAINSKAAQSDLDALSGTVNGHISDSVIHVTSSDKEKWNKVDDKADTTALTAVNDALTAHTADITIHLTSGEVQTMIESATTPIYQTIEDNEEVTAAALNNLNEALNGKQDQLIAGENITISGNVISATGGGGGGTVESAITSGSTNAVESKAIWSATTFNKEVTLQWSGIYSTNYPQGCTKIKVENITNYSSNNIYFNDDSGTLWSNITIRNMGSISVDTSNFQGASYEIDGSTVIISYPTVTTVTKLNVGENGRYTYKAIVEGAWIADNTYMKEEVDAIQNTLQNNINQKLDATAYTPTVVDSSLNVASTNPVQNQALYSELRIGNGGETETTIEWSGNNSTNYPQGCTKIKVENITNYSTNTIDFNGDNWANFGRIQVNNWGSITVDTSNFQGATYEISGTTVIISYPTVTTVTKLNVSENGRYTYKAITTEPPTVLKNQVVENTAALATKQNQLTAGSGISIDANNVISATGGTGGGISSAECQTMIDQSISGKTNQTDFVSHSGNTSIHVTTAQTAAWDAKSDFSGSYNDLIDKPTIPNYTAGSGITISNNVISAKIWSGTQAQYDALTVKDNDTIYLIYNS